jgi:N-acetylmuramoyl-L-alanine amidase
VRAFQRRYRPDLIDGVIDGHCRAILLSLLTGGDKAAALREGDGG